MLSQVSSLLPVFDAPRFVRDLLNNREELSAFDTAMLTELRWWVDQWLDTGRPEGSRSEGSHPNIFKMCQRVGREKADLLCLAPTTCTFTPTTGGLLLAQPFHAGGVAENAEPSDVALRLFRQLTLHPECEKLCGPCPTCGLYFLKQTRHFAKYCSRKCGSNTTARTATQKRNDTLHAELLRLSREALIEYVKKKRNRTWEAWTVAWLKKHGHERQAKSLHRWVNDETDQPGTGLKLPSEIESLHTKVTKRRERNG
jgi:hypothetical protein